LEVTREELDMARERHSKAVARWNGACTAARKWIESRDPERDQMKAASR
jgi:hypothetical protein